MSVDPLPGQQCSNCGTTKTPLWRRAPDGTLICNACGLYYRSNNAHRPVNLKRPPNTIPVSSEQGSCRGDGHCNGTGGSAACRGCPAYNNRVVIKKESDKHSESDEETAKLPQSPGHNATSTNGASAGAEDSDMAIACFNCGTTITPLWRRDDSGNTICNACGLYYKLHKSHRPVKMKRNTIKRRKRHLNETSLSSGSENHRIEKPKKLPNLAPKKSPKSSTHSPRSQALRPLPPLASGPMNAPIANAPIANGPTNGPPMLGHPAPSHMAPPGFGPPHGPPHGPSHYPPYTFHPYVGLRIPNGPGPVPGPPPPMGFAYTMSAQAPYMYGGATVPPGPVPGPGMHSMVRTPPHAGQGSALSQLPPIKLPQLNLPKGNQASAIHTAPKSPKSPKSPAETKKTKTPIPVDFTTAFPKQEPVDDKVPETRLSIGGLLNKK